MVRALPDLIAGVVSLSPANWWDEINQSVKWQDGIFYSLSGAFALVSAVALVRIHTIFCYILLPMYLNLFAQMWIISPSLELEDREVLTSWRCQSQPWSVSIVIDTKQECLRSQGIEIMTIYKLFEASIGILLGI